jgi:hypothetical protein
MAPRVARIPCRMAAPSKAGPAGAEHARIRPREPRAISPLVPMSTANRISADSSSPVAMITASVSAPT